MFNRLRLLFAMQLDRVTRRGPTLADALIVCALLAFPFQWVFGDRYEVTSIPSGDGFSRPVALVEDKRFGTVYQVDRIGNTSSVLPKTWAWPDWLTVKFTPKPVDSFAGVVDVEPSRQEEARENYARQESWRFWTGLPLTVAATTAGIALFLFFRSRRKR